MIDLELSLKVFHQNNVGEYSPSPSLTETRLLTKSKETVLNLFDFFNCVYLSSVIFEVVMNRDYRLWIILWATVPQLILPQFKPPVSCTSQHESLASLATYGIAFGSWCLISAPYFSQTFVWVHGHISSPGLCYWSWGDKQGVGGKEVQASACRNQKCTSITGARRRTICR